jgi:hypothetical protein
MNNIDYCNINNIIYKNMIIDYNYLYWIFNFLEDKYLNHKFKFKSKRNMTVKKQNELSKK